MTIDIESIAKEGFKKQKEYNKKSDDEKSKYLEILNNQIKVMLSSSGIAYPEMYIILYAILNDTEMTIKEMDKHYKTDIFPQLEKTISLYRYNK